MTGVSDRTRIREAEAEAEFWKARCYQLSDAVTGLADQLAEAKARLPTEEAVGEVIDAPTPPKPRGKGR